MPALMGGEFEEVFDRQLVGMITPEGPVVVDFPVEAPIRKLTLMTNKEVQDPSFSAGKHKVKPSWVGAPDGKVHSFVSVATSIDQDDLGAVDIEFTLPEGWLKENAVHKSDVVLSRWVDGEWMDLETEVIGNSSMITFKASSPGLNLFALRDVFAVRGYNLDEDKGSGAVDKDLEKTESNTPEPEPKATEPQTKTTLMESDAVKTPVPEENSWWPTVTIAIAAIAVTAVASLTYLRRR